MRLCMHPPHALGVTAPPSLGPPWDLESAPCLCLLCAPSPPAPGEAMSGMRAPRAARSAPARAFAIWRPVVHRVEVNPPNRCEMSPVSRFRVVRSDTSCDTAHIRRPCHMCLCAWLDGDATQRTCERRDAQARVDNDRVRKSGFRAPSTKVGGKPPG